MREQEEKGYLELFFDDYDEFIDFIRPDQKKLKNYFDNECAELLYRGQGDSDWLLIPSLYRVDDRSFDIYRTTFHKLYHAHLSRLRSFMRACDRNQVLLPHDSVEFRHKILNSKSLLIDQVMDASMVAPVPIMYEFLAFAQHYGIATEFLDWSKNLLCSLLFMSLSVIERQKVQGNMSLWIFNPEKSNLLNQGNHEKIFEIIAVPHGLNRNISAQQGCFTLIRQELDNQQILTVDCERNRISEIKLLDELIYQKKLSNMLVKITLPNRLALKIIAYCESYGMSSAMLYGGAEGAAQYANYVFMQENFENLMSER